MKNKAEFDVINADLFKRLKGLTDDIEAIYSLTKNYEDLLSKVIGSNFFTNTEKDEILLIVGRSMSNLVERIKKLQWFNKLDVNNSNNINSNSHIVFLGHRGGLCNRLRALAALDIITNNIDIKFSWCWFSTLSCTGILPPNRNFLSLSNLIYYKLTGCEKDIVIVDDPNSLGFFYNYFKNILKNTDYTKLSKEYVRVSKILLFSLIYHYNLFSKVFRFIEENSKGKYDSVHIRRTDFVEHFQEKYPNEVLPSIEQYISYIKSNSDIRFFLSTDEENVRKRIKEECHNVFVWNHIFDDVKLRQVAFEDTILDLAVLMHSDKIVITPHSSFSQYAYEAGGVTPIKI